MTKTVKKNILYDQLVKDGYSVKIPMQGFVTDLYVMYNDLLIDISVCRGGIYVCVDDNMSSTYRKNFTRHKTISGIIKSIDRRIASHDFYTNHNMKNIIQKQETPKPYYDLYDLNDIN